MILINHEYHVVELDARFVTDNVREWCENKFGPGDGHRWFQRYNKIFFANSSDHLMFLLAWCDK